MVTKDSDGNWVGEPANVPLYYILFGTFCNSAPGCQLLSPSLFNSALKDLLDAWGSFLTTSKSTTSLTDGMEGWFGPISMQDLTAKGRGAFNHTYICPDPSVIDRGFTSWDAFFTREVKEEARPVACATDDTVIHNACESTVFKIATGVGCEDKFWMKGISYSMREMLQDMDMASYLAGGTVYQAFLSPQDYHRWRSPVDASGRVTKVQLIAGSYFAAVPDLDPTAECGDATPGAGVTMVATRALVYIQADNEDIGLMVFIAVGMAEVSTCDVTVIEGQRVRSGEQLGMFHFGGSSYDMIFRREAGILFSGGVEVGKHVKVNEALGRVGSRGL